MKDQNVYHFKSDELEKSVSSINEEGIAFAEELAHDNAGLNLPKQDSPIKVFIGPLTAFYNKAIGKIQSVLSSALSKYDLEQAEQELREKESAAAKELQEVDNVIRLKVREKEKVEKKGTVPLQKAKRWRRLRPFNFCVILLDIGFSSTAFMQMGYSLLFSMAIAIGIGISIFLLSEHWPDILEKLKTWKQKLMLTIVLYIALTVVFYVIGYFRTTGLSTTSGIATSPWYFCILNLFFFTVVTAVVIINKPNRSERKKLDDYKTLLEEISEAEAKKNDINQGLSDARENFKDKKESREKVMLYAISLEALVVNYYESACQVYSTQNVQRRNDGLVPVMFSEDPPALTLYFTNLKN